MLKTKLLPSVQGERLIVIDILRGFALFGILLVNMNEFHSPSMYASMLQIDLWDGRLDTIANNLIQWGAQGKFYTLFSILFGMSFILLAHRIHEKSGSVSRVFRKRLLFLLVIGVLHLVLFWWGDVLTWYALGGFVLLVFLPSRPKTWLIWALALVMIYVLLIGLASGLFSTSMDAQQMEVTNSIDQLQARMTGSYYSYTGHFGDVFRQRMDDISFVYTGLLMTTLFLVVPLFLLGMFIAKSNIGWFANSLSQEQLQRLKKWVLFLFLTGVFFTILKEWSAIHLLPVIISGYDVMNFAFSVIGDTAFCLFYVAILIGLYHWRRTWRIWSYLASAGRMAMSNYLLQTLVCTTIFYGYGLALYGRIGPALGTIIAIVLYVCQLIWSKWWLQRFQQGPIETIWRKFTYYNATRLTQTKQIDKEG